MNQADDVSEADEAELERLSSALEQVDRLPLSDAQREALKKSALALSIAFLHDLRGDIARQYGRLGQQLSEEERQRMRARGTDPDASASI